jgi:hypothetical protein
MFCGVFFIFRYDHCVLMSYLQRIDAQKSETKDVIISTGHHTFSRCGFSHWTGR